MKKARILQEAANETIAAASWYDKERDGLGAEFANAVETAIDLIEADMLPLSPMPGKSGAKGLKRLILKRFPYDIVVIESTDEVIIIAVAHHSRKPGYWRQRISP
ncbi:type II toxin-antitoxin system RelE/ParE family toxin [Nitrosomonas halophila]|jgi:toxin ParE1/3/4|uniref:ParE toxin of type II toxin-antitoxin system, parDE n=1 Tax=Nitrosomonas halophila TaxID=44576 RepID=A0A1H3LZE5_9PROT|nr:type II toxin-antitoxin system RelE/ParE family toxin [Nitrosomonas halophila]SDY69399.1 ParE toxin of type II toxin-antitoxin system, parDE [Nitrosomonas halophila]